MSYATGKTQELGAQIFKHMHGGILEINQLERPFDSIESVGVLHHMDDPLTGWKVLVDKLVRVD